MTASKPCPFCGEPLRHVESRALAIPGEPIYHEYHHPAHDCILSRRSWFPGRDPSGFLATWNKRAPLQPAAMPA